MEKGNGLDLIQRQSLDQVLWAECRQFRVPKLQSKNGSTSAKPN
jgi:hypothetical protein